MDTAVQNFGRQVQGADVALFYYAGHGVQVSGANYLVPVSANPTREADVDFQMVDVNLVLRQMQGSGTRLNMVILDACRNNPFGSRGLRASDGGLAQMRAPEGTLISYATQPGNVAQDGKDGNSPYTKALASTIKQSGLDIFQTFNQVGLAVKRETGGSQQPWVSSSPIDGTFYFVAPTASPSSPQAALAAPSEPRLADTLRPDPDRIPIKDTALLRELSDRLYEHNFDPEPLDSKNGMRVAIRQFQQKTDMTANGEATEGVLTRLRKMDDLKPWGSIVYNPDQRQVRHILETGFAPRRRRRGTVNVQRRQMYARIELLRPAVRRLRSLGQILVAKAERQRASGPSRRRLTSATRLANLAALSMRCAPNETAAARISSVIGNKSLCETPFDVRSGLACSPC